MNSLVRKLLFVPKCMVCGRVADKDNICDKCFDELKNQKIRPGDMPEKDIDFVDKVYASYHYDGAARRALLRAKINNPSSFLTGFTEYISVDIRRILEENKVDMIISAPFHTSKLYKSEYDLPCEMAKRISKIFDIEYRTPVRKIKSTPKQHDLSKEERKANLIGAFKVTEPVNGKSILIIDDVITTGNTLSNIALELRAAGRSRVYRWAYTLNEFKEKGDR